jgi:hypothetical protein
LTQQTAVNTLPVVVGNKYSDTADDQKSNEIAYSINYNKMECKILVSYWDKWIFLRRNLKYLTNVFDFFFLTNIKT